MINFRQHLQNNCGLTLPNLHSQNMGYVSQNISCFS